MTPIRAVLFDMDGVIRHWDEEGERAGVPRAEAFRRLRLGG